LLQSLSYNFEEKSTKYVEHCLHLNNVGACCTVEQGYTLQIVVDAEIISLDAFNRSERVGVVAVAFMKVTIV